MATFAEDFSTDQAGMYGWVGNQEGPKPLDYLPHEDGGAVLSRSPWWIDYNHAPNPIGLGAGYLHMVYSYSTTGPIPELYAEVGGGRGGGEHTNAFEPIVSGDGLVLAPHSALGFTGPSADVLTVRATSTRAHALNAPTRSVNLCLPSVYELQLSVAVSALVWVTAPARVVPRGGRAGVAAAAAMHVQPGGQG